MQTDLHGISSSYSCSSRINRFSVKGPDASSTSQQKHPSPYLVVILTSLFYILKTKCSNTECNNIFEGALSDEVDRYVTTGKLPDYEEYQLLGYHAL
jgi:hypothetical protein